VVPSNLAYGTRGAGTNIGANETLVFNIELVAIVQ
jgi:FKBP-type peptidyl-prolyl cis-trans isomerase FklB